MKEPSDSEEVFFIVLFIIIKFYNILTVVIIIIIITVIIFGWSSPTHTAVTGDVHIKRSKIICFKS